MFCNIFPLLLIFSLRLKVKAATWALEHGVNVVICNGSAQHTIKAIMDGRKVGTFFTNVQQMGNPPEVQAALGSYRYL